MVETVAEIKTGIACQSCGEVFHCPLAGSVDLSHALTIAAMHRQAAGWDEAEKRLAVQAGVIERLEAELTVLKGSQSAPPAALDPVRVVPARYDDNGRSVVVRPASVPYER